MEVKLITVTKGVGKYKGLSFEEIISAIARHGVLKEDNGRLVRYLMDHKHWSPLEQIHFGFEIETSRAIGRQMLRHKLHVQEHSQRYSNRVKFEPVELRKEHPVNRQSSTEVCNPYIMISEEIKAPAGDLIKRLLKETELIYNKLIEAGVSKESARMILPECTTTTMTFTGCLRNWLSFLNVRMEKSAQKEIVEIATIIGEELEKQMPNIFSTIDWRNGLFM